MTRRRRTPTFHIASDFYHELIKTGIEAGPACLCIQGNEAAVRQEIAPWRDPRHNDLNTKQEGQLCSNTQLYHRVLEHRVSAVFLVDYSQSIRRKKQQRINDSCYGGKEEKKKKLFKSSEDRYHFKHSDSMEGQIDSYKKFRRERLMNLQAKDPPVDVFDGLCMDSVAKDPLLLSGESVADPGPHYSTFVQPLHFKRAPVIIYNTGEVYAEPFNPALYGAFNPKLRTAVIRNEDRRTYVMKTQQNASDFDCWVPENAVYRTRKPSTRVRSYNSVGYCENETIKLKPLPKRKSSIHGEKLSKSKEQEKTLVTYIQTVSGRPTATVHFKEKTKSNLKHTPGYNESNAANLNKQLLTISGDTGKCEKNLSVSGKLRLGRIKSPCLAREDNDQQSAYDLVVYSSSCKTSQPHLIDPSQNTDSETNHSGKNENTSRKIKVYEQESVQSIPSITSSRNFLPGLEVTPTSSIHNEAQCSSRGGLGTTKNVDWSSCRQSSKQILSHQVNLENGSRQEKIAGEIVTRQSTTVNHSRSHEQGRQIFVPDLITYLNSVSFKQTNLKSHSLCRIELDKERSSRLPPPTPQTNTIATSGTSSLSLSQSYTAWTHNISHDQLVHKDSRELHHDRKSKSSSGKRNRVVFRSNETESPISHMATLRYSNSLNDEAQECMRCELRSQQRRQRQHQKTVTGRVHVGGTSTNTTNGICQDSCTQVTRPKVRVYIKGKEKSFVDFLPSINFDRDSTKVSF